MERTRLGISVGLLGAAIYLMGLFGGYIPIILLTGYVLLFEGNIWLKKSAVMAVFIVFSFAFASVLIGLIPDSVDLISSLLNIFDVSFSLPILSDIIILINNVLGMTGKVILILLALMATTQSGPTGLIDKLVGKHMN